MTKMKISNLFLLLLSGLFAITAILTVAVVNHQMRNEALEEASVKSRLILDRNLATHTYFSQDMKPAIFAWSEPFLSPDYFDPTWMSSTHAVRAIDRYFRELSPREYYYKECALNARDPQNEADPEEMAFIVRLNEDPSLEFWNGVREFDGKPFFVVMRKAEVMETSCLRCHGSPGDAPKDLIRIYGDSRSFHRRLGEVVSAISIRIPLAAEFAAVNHVSYRLTAILLLILGALLAGHYWVTNRLVVDPLNRIRRKAMEISRGEGQLGEEIPLPRGTDLAELTRAFNAMSKQLRHNQDNLEELVLQRTQELDRVNEQLRLEEAEKTLILDNMAELVILYDADRRVVWANAAVARYLDMPKDALEGLSCARVFHQSSEECGRCPVRETTDTGVLQEDEGEYTPGRTWVMRAIPVHDDQGRVANVIQIARDVTVRKEAQEQLREQLRFLQDLMEAIPSPIFFKDSEGRYRGCNQAYERLFKLSRDEMLGKTVDQFAPAEMAERCRETDRAILEGAGSLSYEQTLYGAEGDARLVIYKAPFFSAGGKAGGVVGAVVDTTERRRLEEQLHHADKMQAIGTLAGGIAHDFNNILAIIMGYGEIALMELNRDSHEAQCLLEILEASRRAKELIKQILSFSRHSDVERRPLQLGVVVKETLKLLRASLPATIEMRQEVHSTSLVKGDPTEIHQIVMNLCTNAYQAMKGCRGILEVSLTDFDATSACRLDYHDLRPGRYVKLTVRDTGSGIDTALKDRIFDPYFTTKSPEEGTGLGLAIVHGIVMAYGGSISVDSQPRQGASISIYLPIIEQAAIPAGSRSPEEIPRGRERVLLVDDEAHITAIGKEMLELLGYRVTAFSSSEEAWRAFQQNPGGFDVLVTDLTMPQLTGMELAERILAVRADLPVILCSGYAQPQDDQSSRFKGNSRYAYLAKPFNIQSLAGTLRMVLNDSPKSGPARER